jgi:ATP-dependent DNA helicase Rep
MTSARQRTIFGNTSRTTPSRFVDEIPEHDLIRIGGEGSVISEEENQQAGKESLAALKTLFS